MSFLKTFFECYNNYTCPYGTIDLRDKTLVQVMTHPWAMYHNCVKYNLNPTWWQHSEKCMCRLPNIAMRDYQESVTTRQTHTRADRQTLDKVIPMCRYASQATQKLQ